MSTKWRFDTTTALMCILAVVFMLCDRHWIAVAGAVAGLYAAWKIIRRWPEIRSALGRVSPFRLAELLRQPLLPHLFIYLIVLAALLPFSTNVRGSALVWGRTVLFFGTSLLVFVCLKQVSYRAGRAHAVIHAVLLGNTLNAVSGLYQVWRWRTLHVDGFCPNYVYFGALLVQAVLLALALLLAERRALRRVAYAGVICVCGAALLCSEARGPWLAFILAGPVVAYLSRRSIVRDRNWTRLCLGAGAVLALALAPLYIRHLLTIFNPRWMSNWERVLIWESTLRLIRDHFWTGVGSGQFAAIYNARYISPASIERWHPHAHNSFLEITAENGIFGLAAGIYLLYGVVVFLRNTLRAAPHDAYATGTAGVFCAVFVGSLVDFFLFSGFLHAEWVLWLLVGLVYYDHWPQRQARQVEMQREDCPEMALA